MAVCARGTLRVPMTLFNPFDPSYTDHPYPALAALRASEPVYFSDVLQAWIVTRYADCLSVLHDAKTFRSDFLSLEGERWIEARRRSQLFLDGVPALSAMAEPDHHRMRAVVGGTFAVHGLERLRMQIESAVDGLLDGAVPGVPFDVMGGLAFPLPRLIVLAQLGVAEADRDAFMEHVSRIAGAVFGSGDAEEARQALDARDALATYLAGLSEDTLDAHGMLARVVEAGGSGTLSPSEALGLVVDVALAGNDPTACLIGNGVLALVQHPEQFQILRARPELVPQAVEEFLRFDSPLHTLMRIVDASVTLAGQALQAGDVVYVMPGAANRDPAQFRDPDRLDILRSSSHHLGFGGGPHHCLGAPLARMEAAIVFSRLIERFPTMRLAPLGVEREVEFELRGPSRLRVLLD